MCRALTASKNLIAIFGLLALLIATLEHEDLIFQDSPFAVGAAAGRTDAELNTPVAWLTSQFADSGTEGTYRLRGHHLWLLPILALAAMLRPSQIGSARHAWWWRIGGRRQVRPFAAGGFVLRP